MKLKIFIADNQPFEDYSKWLISDSIDLIKLTEANAIVNNIRKCDGIILPGGADVSPVLYNGDSSLSKKTNLTRDIFELNLAEKALIYNKPVLGICRGLQLINVLMGGTLIPDIADCRGNFNHHKINGGDQLHEISIIKHTLLNTILPSTDEIVNSAHHQAVDSLGKGLIASSNSDEIIESLEWADHSNKPWMLLLQWHPERLRNINFKVFNEIRKAFILACKTR